MPLSADIAIVGAGAAGLATAIFAAEVLGGGSPSRRVVLVDAAAKVGAKMLVSGGGRCNVTNQRVTPEDFHGAKPFLRQVLRRFDQPATVAWFESLGVRLKREDTGKLFPATDRAATVLEAMLARCRQLGVELRTGCRVDAVEQTSSGFRLSGSAKTLQARRLVLATGGRSLPRTGSDGSGYTLARALGHRVTQTFPALVPLVLDKSFFHASLSGVSHPVELTTRVAGKSVDRRSGELLWTHFGVSGPVVLDASRFWTMADAAGQSPDLRCNLLPSPGEDPFQHVESWLLDSASRQPQRPLAALLSEHLPRRVAEVICKFCSLSPQLVLGQLPREGRRRLIAALIDLPLPVVADRGWNYAEVTAGGVPLGEVDPKTMQSRLTPGLYLVGEILDCDGRLGGFNFQWAWSTAHVAARAVSVSLSRESETRY